MSRHIPTRIISLTFDETRLLIDALDCWCGELKANEAYYRPHKKASENVMVRIAQIRARLAALLPPEDAA